MTILISAGHSNTDPGAVSGGYKEAELAVQFRNAVAHYLREAGVDFVTDGEGKNNAPLREAMARAKGKVVAVEFHFNAAANQNAKGVEVLAAHHNRKLAQDISAAVAEHTGTPLRGDKGYKPENAGQHARLGFVRVGGLVVELEFISNPTAMQKYLAVYWKIARSVANVLIEYHEDNK